MGFYDPDMLVWTNESGCVRTCEIFKHANMAIVSEVPQYMITEFLLVERGLMHILPQIKFHFLCINFKLNQKHVITYI